MASETYTCQNCGETYRKVDGWTDWDAAAEQVERTGYHPAEIDSVIICDDCDKFIQTWWENLSTGIRAEFEAEMRREVGRG